MENNISQFPIIWETTLTKQPQNAHENTMLRRMQTHVFKTSACWHCEEVFMVKF